MITIPFDLELAKKINNGERNGMIVTDGDNYRVEFVYHREESFPILGVIHTDHGIISDWFSNNGFGGKNYRLKLKVPEYTKMENKEQDFINRYKNVQESIVKAMDKALERAIGNKVIDFEKCEGNYLDVYPLIGAVLQKELRSVLDGNVNKSISRNMKIKATKYRNDYRVWLDYAGDYRNENIE